MKIHTKTVFDIESGVVIEDHFYEYSGPVEKVCGGDALADSKKKEAQSQIDLNKSLASGYNARNAAQQPYLMNEMKNGLPYKSQLLDYNNGTLARAAAPARASLLRSLSGFGDTLPSGFKEGVLGDFNANLARGFDDSIVSTLDKDQAVKDSAADRLNPLGFAGGASSAAGSVLSAPAVASGGFGNFLGGLASGLANKASVGSGGAWSV